MEPGHLGQARVVREHVSLELDEPPRGAVVRAVAREPFEIGRATPQRSNARLSVTRAGWGRSLVPTLTAGGSYTLIMFAGLALAPAGHGAVIIPGATPVVSTVLVWL